MPIDEKYIKNILETLNNIYESLSTLEKIFLMQVYASKYENLSKQEQKQLLELEHVRIKQKILADYYWDLTKVNFIIFTIIGLAISAIPRGVLDEHLKSLLFTYYIPLGAGLLIFLLGYAVQQRIVLLRYYQIYEYPPILAGSLVTAIIASAGLAIIMSLVTINPDFFTILILGFLAVPVFSVLKRILSTIIQRRYKKEGAQDTLWRFNVVNRRIEK